MSCPNCGHSGVVSKEKAWDALDQVSPDVQRELQRLRPLAEIARNIAMFSGPHAPGEAVTIPVPSKYVDALRESFGMDPLIDPKDHR